MSHNEVQPFENIVLTPFKIFYFRNNHNLTGYAALRRMISRPLSTTFWVSEWPNQSFFCIHLDRLDLTFFICLTSIEEKTTFHLNLTKINLIRLVSLFKALDRKLTRFLAYLIEKWNFLSNSVFGDKIHCLK